MFQRWAPRRPVPLGTDLDVGDALCLSPFLLLPLCMAALIHRLRQVCRTHCCCSTAAVPGIVWVRLNPQKTPREKAGNIKPACRGQGGTAMAASHQALRQLLRASHAAQLFPDSKTLV